MSSVSPLSRPIQPPTARGLCRVEAARYIGLSPATFDKLVFDGTMPKPKRIGTRTIWDVRALDVAFDELGGDGAVEAMSDWDCVLSS